LKACFKFNCLYLCLSLLWPLGCFNPQEGQSLEKNLPKGFTARFEGVTYRQLRFDQHRWLSGTADAVNANPLKLNFDLEGAQGTIWLEEGSHYRDFNVNALELRGEKSKARLRRHGVVGLAPNQWLRLENASIDEKDLLLTTKQTAWVISPNFWMTSPKGLKANLPQGEVTSSSEIRLEAFDVNN